LESKTETDGFTSSHLKILVIVKTVDLGVGWGSIPGWWQLLKALYESGAELALVPCCGETAKSLWWHTYRKMPGGFSLAEKLDLKGVSFPIPFSGQGGQRLPWQPVDAISDSKKSPTRKLRNLVYSFVKNYGVDLQRKKYVDTIVRKEENIDAVLFLGTESYLNSRILPAFMRKRFGVPVVYMEQDMPGVLPKYRSNSPYVDADLSEFDAFIVNSKGAMSEVRELGANDVHVVYWGVDPQVFAPVYVEQDLDISFYGISSFYRERYIEYMIGGPSRKMKERVFAVGGYGHASGFGLAKNIGFSSFDRLRYQCCRSRLNLNITRWPFAETYASSTCRPFELASLGCCIVSNPCRGINEWFEPNKEIVVVSDEKEAIETYNWLLCSENERLRLARNARARALKDHTYANRARSLLDIMKSLQ
jgi:glycosyltransferase involved in cell wall biosynthesis